MGGHEPETGCSPPPFGHVGPSPSTEMRCYVPPPVTTRPGVPRHTTSPASASERLRAGSTVGSQPLARDQPVAAGDPRPAELTAPLGLRLAFSSSCPAKAAPAPRGAGTGGPKRRPSRPQPPPPSYSWTFMEEGLDMFAAEAKRKSRLRIPSLCATESHVA